MTHRKKSTTARRTSANRKINRAQRKAIEVRAAESRAVTQPIDEPLVENVPSKAGSRPRARRRSAHTIAPKPPAITRAQEYAFIRSDFRRLLVTAGSLLAAMLMLLFIID